MSTSPRLSIVSVTAVALLLAAPAHAVIGLTSSALHVNDASGNAIPSANLQISLLGNEGQDVDYNIQANERGQVPVQYVPDDQWNPDNAWDGKRLSLSGGPTFGSIVYNGDSEGNGAYQQDFSIVDKDMYSVGVGLGYLLDNQLSLKYDYDYKDEIPDNPGTGVLDPNSRYTFTSPLSCNQLGSMLEDNAFAGARAGQTPFGCQVSVPGGPDPSGLLAILGDLEAKGDINDVEKDYCVEFLPRGGIHDGGPEHPPRFADFGAASPVFSYPGSYTSGGGQPSGGYGQCEGACPGSEYSGEIVEPWKGQPVDAAVSVNPLSPLPNFDPGERTGDWDAPNLSWSGDDGKWNIRLNYNYADEPVEINYATRWASASIPSVQHVPMIGNLFSTRARDLDDEPLTLYIRPRLAGFIMDKQWGDGSATAGASAPPPETTPPEGSTPPEEKPPEGNVCGPDVTDYMLKNIEYMEKQYAGWSEAEKDRRCVDLYSVVGTDGSLFKFNFSWDMIGFAPGDNGESQTPGEPGYMESIFLMSAAPGWCAKPRNPCGRTAEFAGYCVDVQIMNYLQWGAMNKLCDTSILQRMAHDARKLVFRTPALISAQQTAFSNFGEYLVSTSRGHDFSKAVTKSLADHYFGEIEGFSGRPANNCALKCDQARAEPGLQNREWGFRWGGNREDDRDRFPVRGSDLIKR